MSRYININWENEDGLEIVTSVPARFEVCNNCDGEGKHLHNSIRYVDFTPEEMSEDHDFKNDYFNGAYDVVCETCNGRTTVLKPYRHDFLSEDQKNALDYIDRQQEENENYRRICEAERRMGA